MVDDPTDHTPTSASHLSDEIPHPGQSVSEPPDLAAGVSELADPITDGMASETISANGAEDPPSPPERQSPNQEDRQSAGPRCGSSITFFYTH